MVSGPTACHATLCRTTFSMIWRSVAGESPTPPAKGPAAPPFSALQGSVALQVASWKVSRYRGVSQLHCRLSCCSGPLSFYSRTSWVAFSSWAVCQGFFQEGNDPWRHSGQWPTKGGNRFIKASGLFSGTPLWWNTAPQKKPIKRSMISQRLVRTGQSTFEIQRGTAKFSCDFSLSTSPQEGQGMLVLLFSQTAEGRQKTRPPPQRTHMGLDHFTKSQHWSSSERLGCISWCPVFALWFLSFLFCSLAAPRRMMIADDTTEQVFWPISAILALSVFPNSWDDGRKNWCNIDLSNNG